MTPTTITPPITITTTMTPTTITPPITTTTVTITITLPITLRVKPGRHRSKNAKYKRVLLLPQKFSYRAQNQRLHATTWTHKLVRMGLNFRAPGPFSTGWYLKSVQPRLYPKKNY